MTTDPVFKVVGLDPGFASLGWSVVGIGPDRDPRCLAAGVFRTERDQSIPVNDDNVRRIKSISAFLQQMDAEHAPIIVGIEAMSWTRFAKADRSIAMFWGAAAAVMRGPFVMTTPSDIKKEATGAKSASKTNVIRSMQKRLPGFGECLDGIKAQTMHNHAADAAAAALVALRSPLAEAAMRIMKGIPCKPALT